MERCRSLPSSRCSGSTFVGQDRNGLCCCVLASSVHFIHVAGSHLMSSSYVSSHSLPLGVCSPPSSSVSVPSELVSPPDQWHSQRSTSFAAHRLCQRVRFASNTPSTSNIGLPDGSALDHDAMGRIHSALPVPSETMDDLLAAITGTQTGWQKSIPTSAPWVTPWVSSTQVLVTWNRNSTCSHLVLLRLRPGSASRVSGSTLSWISRNLSAISGSLEDLHNFLTGNSEFRIVSCLAPASVSLRKHLAEFRTFSSRRRYQILTLFSVRLSRVAICGTCRCI